MLPERNWWMNKTKEKIYEEGRENTKKWKDKGIEWFSAGEIGMRLGISRTLASQYLNEMVREGRLVKTSNRPVAYLEKKFWKICIQIETLQIQ